MDYYQSYRQCLQQKQPEQALQQLLQHLKANPGHAYGFFQSGALLRDLGQLPQALCAFLESSRLDPERYEAYLNLGVTYRELQQPELAIQAYNKAYEKKSIPAIRYNRAMALLLAGRYQEGWKEHEWRLQIPPTPHPLDRLWQGQPFPDQTLLVYSEQGLGDDLQFCRFLPYVKALGGKVVFATRPELITILSTLHGVDQVVEHSPTTDETMNFPMSLPVMSLPYLCGATLDSIPNQTPYLYVPPAYR